MQIFRTLEFDTGARVGWGVRVLLASPSGENGHIARRLADLGGLVEVQAQLYDALAVLADDPRAAQMLVVDCDAYGGIVAAGRIATTLIRTDSGMPIVLITADCTEQTIREGRASPTILRAPVSAVALRLAFEMAFRDRRVMSED